MRRRSSEQPRGRATRGSCTIFATALIASLALAAPAAAAAPTNDEITGAIEITGVPFSHTQAVNEATVGVDDPGCPSGYRTVWYRFSPTETTAVDVNTAGSNFAALIGVYAGPATSLDVGCGHSLRLTLTAGQTYYFVVSSESEGERASLTFNLELPPAPPSIDVRKNARKIMRLPYATTVDTRETTIDAGEPSCAGATKTVWFSYSSRRDRKLRATTNRSDYDTALAIYVNRRATLSQLHCADNTGDSLLARQRFAVEAGRVYFFQVGAVDGRGGRLRFNLEEPPPILRGHARLMRSGDVNLVTGIARVAFAVRCTRSDARMSISGSMRQRFHHRRVVWGTFRETLKCGPRPIVQRVRIGGGRRPFVPGLVGVEIDVLVVHGDDRVRRHRAGPVRLRGCKCFW